MKPLNLFAVLMCCCYVAVAQNIPSGSGNPPSERGGFAGAGAGGHGCAALPQHGGRRRGREEASGAV